VSRPLVLGSTIRKSDTWGAEPLPPCFGRVVPWSVEDVAGLVGVGTGPGRPECVDALGQGEVVVHAQSRTRSSRTSNSPSSSGSGRAPLLSSGGVTDVDGLVTSMRGPI